MRSIGAVLVFLTALGLAACQANPGPFYPPAASASTAPPASQNATVSFLIVVPSATASTSKRRTITLPSNATSVSFVLDSVNGTTYTGTPTTETLVASNSACTSVSGQLSCAFNVSVPAGTDVFTVKVYGAGNALLVEGNVSVNATAGGAVSAPLTMTGTVAKIAIAVSSGVVGIAGTFPVTVQAEDSNGATILGTYSSPITITDSDTSGATTIATTGSDNPTSGTLLSSSDSTMLTYNGATLANAAVIGATASGVTVSNVTTASFTAATHDLAQSNTLTYGVTEVSGSGYNGPPSASPYPNSTSTSYPIAVASPVAAGAGVPNVSGLIAVTEPTPAGSPWYGLSTGGAINYTVSPAGTIYDAWSVQNGASVLGLVGFQDSGSYMNDVMDYSGLETELCASPYQQNLMVPVQPSWNVLSGSGACTFDWNDGAGDTETTTINNDGSYSDVLATSRNLLPSQQTITVSSTGSVQFSTVNLADSGTMTLPTPSANSSSMPVAFGNPNGNPFFNTPAPTTAPNPWAIAGAPNGQPPSPLMSDTMTGITSIAALPSECAVASTLVPATNPALSEARETAIYADPMGTIYDAFYQTQNITHYYLNGVGEICTEDQLVEYYYDGWTDGRENFYSDNYAVGGALEFYLGDDPNIDSYGTTTWTYITSTTLQAANNRVRDITKALTTASAGLHAASYALVHGSPHRFHVHTANTKWSPGQWGSLRRT